MEPRPDNETVDQTLMTSVEQVKTSRDLLQEIDKRLARGNEVLNDHRPTIDLGDASDPDER